MFDRGWIALIACLLLPMPPAWAHKPSDSYLHLDLRSEPAELRWDIALRDLHLALGLDRDDDGRLTWGEVQRAHPRIAGYALSRLAVRAGPTPCTIAADAQSLVDLSDGTYTVLPLRLDCDGRRPDSIDYGLLFDLDPTHRGLLRITSERGESTAIFSPERSRLDLDPTASPGPLKVFRDYWREGVWHIWIGLDHVLFLFTLLLPAVLQRRAGRWQAVPAVRTVGVEVLAIVTAFTVAHSITLSLAVLGLVELPARWVESAIAATLVLAAANNLRPFLPGRPWVIAFALGLIHGLGFASVLIDLGLPGGSLAIALLGFNIGVETGQLALVLLLVPVAYLLRTSDWYRGAGLRWASSAVAGVALIWLAERSLDLHLWPT